MTTYYVRPGTGNDSNAGTTWADASWATLKKAADTVAAGSIIVMSNAAADVITSNTTYTFADNVVVISSADGTSYAAGAAVSSTTFGVDIAVSGKAAFFGITFAAANSGTATLTFPGADNSLQYFESCTLSVPSSSSGSNIVMGAMGTRANLQLQTRNCTFTFGATANGLNVGCRWSSIGDSFAASGSAPATLILDYDTNNSEVIIEGADLSAISGTLVAGFTFSPGDFHFINCKLHASVTPIGTITNQAGGQVTLHDCSYMNGSTLTGKLFYHENYLGSTTISAAIYNNTSGLTIDGTTKVSWVVDGKSTSAAAQPYCSPWLEVYHAGTGEITPFLEVMRDNASGAAYTNAVAWSEWQYKGTADSARATFSASDRAIPLATPADQTASSLGAGDWAGETGTPWFGKLAPASAITPAEIGYLLARVVMVGDYTLYVDPQIFGRS